MVFVFCLTTQYITAKFPGESATMVSEITRLKAENTDAQLSSMQPKRKKATDYASIAGAALSFIKEAQEKNYTLTVVRPPRCFSEQGASMYDSGENIAKETAEIVRDSNTTSSLASIWTFFFLSLLTSSVGDSGKAHSRAS
jgi:hypothetical protein